MQKLTNNQALLNVNIDLLKIQQQIYYNNLLYSIKSLNNFFYDEDIHHLKNIDLISKISLLKDPINLYIKYVNEVLKHDYSNIDYVEDLQVLLNKIKNNRKSYLFDKEFSLSIFDTLNIFEYQKVLNNLENIKQQYAEKRNSNQEKVISTQDIPF